MKHIYHIEDGWIEFDGTPGKSVRVRAKGLGASVSGDIAALPQLYELISQFLQRFDVLKEDPTDN